MLVVLSTLCSVYLNRFPKSLIIYENDFVKTTNDPLSQTVDVLNFFSDFFTSFKFVQIIFFSIFDFIV